MKTTSLRPGTGPDLQGKLSAPSATRTRDLLLRRQLLYPLSYRGQPGLRRPAATARARSSVAGRPADRAVLTGAARRPPGTARHPGRHPTHPARPQGAGPATVVCTQP
jgi:hypothetical protein